MNPYLPQGNPNHPGVQGKPYAAGVEPANQDQMPAKIDMLGTGTFPPESQGVIGRAQPAGLSATANYGEPSPGIVQGDTTLGGPMTHPLPVDAEEGAIGQAPQAVTRESLVAEKQERLQAQIDALGTTKSASDSPNSEPNNGNQEVSVDEEEDEDN